MKYKIKAKQHILNIKIKTGLKEKIDFVKAKEFQGKKLRNFFKINEVNKNSIVFIGPVGISLRERMKKPILFSCFRASSHSPAWVRSDVA